MSATIVGPLQFDSPIEQRLGEILFAMLPPRVKVRTQCIIQAGRLRRVDFDLRYGDASRIIVECDGRNFHKRDEDRERDTAILLNQSIRSVIRFRGCDIHCADQECADFVRMSSPDFFDDQCSPLDRDGLVFLKGVLPKLNIRPIVRTRLEGKLVELSFRDNDGKFHGKPFMATRPVPATVGIGDLFSNTGHAETEQRRQRREEKEFLRRTDERRHDEESESEFDD